MGRASQSLARVAVVVRAGAAPLWWLGLLAAGTGTLLPGLTGRRIGVLTGAALALIVGTVTALARWRRYRGRATAATRAARGDVLQDRRVTLRLWRRAHRWWFAAAFLAAVASSFVLPAAGGLVVAGVGAGLWAKAVRLGQWERDQDRLLWVRADAAQGGRTLRTAAFWCTGVAAGDAEPGGSRRRQAVR
ncbi:hypothetical protein ACFVIM_15615 [Streptomyces sp. NPDC057638]|uniref:hypothetical protein n=1 Tax=Streptomyces sp. NPDC057638 TaxID=3346190 RepID=UPI00368F65F4